MRRVAFAGAAVAVLLLAAVAVAAASGWSIEHTANRKGATQTTLDAVSCASSRACTAVGDYSIGMSKQAPVAERWNGTKWSIEHAPNPTDASDIFLNGVSCASASACTAVGSYSNGTTTLTLAERWNGTKWSIERTPKPTAATSSELSGVSCSSTRACTAVGDYNYGNTTISTVSLAERWNGTKWSIQHTPNPSGKLGVGLRGVSCVSTRACTAAGSYYNGTSAVTLAERWNGTKWSIQHTPNPTGGSDIFFKGVSCVSASVCTAVGQYYNGTSAQVSLAERWNGTNWSIQPTPNPTGELTSFLNAVSCASASACTAVSGLSSNGTTDVTLAERWNGTKWSIQSTPNPTGARSSVLNGVSCSSTRACTAVGDFSNSKGTRVLTLAERWKRGV